MRTSLDYDRGQHAVTWALHDAVEYAIAREEAATDRRFFGSWGTFRRNVLKTMRRRRCSVIFTELERCLAKAG